MGSVQGRGNRVDGYRVDGYGGADLRAVGVVRTGAARGPECLVRLGRFLFAHVLTHVHTHMRTHTIRRGNVSAAGFGRS